MTNLKRVTYNGLPSAHAYDQAGRPSQRALVHASLKFIDDKTGERWDERPSKAEPVPAQAAEVDAIAPEQPTVRNFDLTRSGLAPNPVAGYSAAVMTEHAFAEQTPE